MFVGVGSPTGCQIFRAVEPGADPNPSGEPTLHNPTTDLILLRPEL